MKRVITIVLVLAALSMACGWGGGQTFTQGGNNYQEDEATQDDEATNTPSPTFTITPTSTQTPTVTPTSTPVPIVVGPNNFPKGINPFTGLPATDPALLAVAPVLVSVSNYPVTARPQAGLSYCPFVFEITIGEGMTRFLALFYGEYPQYKPEAESPPPDDYYVDPPDNSSQGNRAAASSQDRVALAEAPGIGPMRSKRLPFDALTRLYNGFLIGAGASADVAEEISQTSNAFGSNPGDINGAMLKVTDLEEIAKSQSSNSNVGNPGFEGNKFDEMPPAGGKDAHKLWVFYSVNAQVLWTYDASSGKYLRFQDEADYQGKFVPHTDRLNGKQLSASNVIVLFALHESRNRAGTLIDIKLKYIKRFPALLFRDGEMYEIFWTTISEEYEKTTGKLRPIRYIDGNGSPFPLKPGNTWVEIVDTTAEYWEIGEDNPSNPVPGSGYWKVRFYAPANPR